LERAAPLLAGPQARSTLGHVPNLRLQLRAGMTLAVARVLLRRRGTTQTLRVLTRARQGAAEIDSSAALRAVQRAGRLLGGQCLAQSVALTAVLARANHEPTLVLGCRPQGSDPWTAHAWVLVDGRVLEPVAGEPHAELARLDAARDWVPAAPNVKN
jgi:hypothetical protein